MNATINTNGSHGPLYELWRFLKLMVGNSKKFNCRTEGYKNKISLSVLSLYLLMFTVGLFAGDFYCTGLAEVEKILGLITTAIIYSLGTSVIYQTCVGKGSKLPAAVAGVMILTQTAFVFNLFPVPVVNILYYMGSLITMIFVYSVSNRDKYKNYGINE